MVLIQTFALAGSAPGTGLSVTVAKSHGGVYSDDHASGKAMSVSVSRVSFVRRVLGSRKYRHICEETVADIAEQELSSGTANRQAASRARKKLHRVLAAYLGEPDYPEARRQLIGAFAAEDQELIRRTCEAILLTHASTRERLPVAEQFFAEILRRVGTPERVLDLACALNPLALRWMGLPRTVAYAAMDINARIVDLVNHYFKLEGLRPLAEHRDVLVRPPRRNADLALLLKMYHCLEHRRPGAGWAVVSGVNATWVAVSFPTRNLRGRWSDIAANYQRMIFENCANKGWGCHRVDVPGEALILIQKG
jgi:16S rRNA (guanine(1405)-N(7))-methyltransferase